MTASNKTALKPDLKDRLAELIDEHGRWRLDRVSELSASDWVDWFRARLDGDDPYFPADRDEFPGDLFRGLLRELHSERLLPNQAMVEGLASFLRELNPSKANALILEEALDLAALSRAASSKARPKLRAVLRDWIDGEFLLKRRAKDIDPKRLHRSALYALVALQRLGDEEDRDIWERALNEPELAAAAYSGMAFSFTDPAPGWTKTLRKNAHKLGDLRVLQHPVEALFLSRRDRQGVYLYLWKEVANEADWNQLRELLRRVTTLPLYEMMGHFGSREAPAGAWNFDVSSIPRFGLPPAA